MCLLVLAWKAHPRFSLIVAANRDEYHERPAAPLSKWPPGNILAGRDLRAGGTWLAMDRNRRFGIITNYRDAQLPERTARSRGELIPEYLNGALDAARFLKNLAGNAAEFGGFNLLLADESALWYGANRAAQFARPLSTGVHGLANHLLDTPWPKLTRVRHRFERSLHAPDAPSATTLLAILNDREPLPSDTDTQTDDVPPHLRRALSAPFVLNADYGTRCSTVLLLEPSGAFQLVERRFDSVGELSGETKIELRANEW